MEIKDKLKSKYLRYKPFIRDINSSWLVELFLVSSISTIALIRFFLYITDYPQVSGGDLHVAHVLVGGIFMLIAIMMLLIFLDRHSLESAALVGGFGFGAFIDELGKFVTSDNNYFYEPTIAMIYVTFVVIYLVFQSVNANPRLKHQERVINALELAKNIPASDLDEHEKQQALDLLDDETCKDPFAKSLREWFEQIEPISTPKPGFYLKTKTRLREIYRQLIEKKWFSKLVVFLFVIQSLWYFFDIFSKFIPDFRESMDFSTFSFFEILEIIAPTVAAFFVVIGAIKIRESRIKAYRNFKTSILIHIFIIQIFEFYREQFFAIFDLGINLLILGILRYMINQELALERVPLKK